MANGESHLPLNNQQAHLDDVTVRAYEYLDRENSAGEQICFLQIVDSLIAEFAGKSDVLLDILHDVKKACSDDADFSTSQECSSENIQRFATSLGQKIQEAVAHKIGSGQISRETYVTSCSVIQEVMQTLGQQLESLLTDN